MPTNNDKMETDTVPDQLFHTILTVVNRRGLQAGADHEVHVLESHGTLEAAKSYTTSQSLEQLGLDPREFAVYAVRSSAKQDEAQDWPHGDGVLVFGRAPTGSEIRIAVATTPNQESLTTGLGGELLLPDGARHLHYILLTSIDYNVDRGGCSLTTDIVGVYVHRREAWAAARKALDGDKLAECDYSDDPKFAGEWPFGEDVAVHAISETGQNYYVAVQKPLWAHTERKHKVRKGLALV